MLVVVACTVAGCGEKNDPLPLPEQQDEAIRAYFEENGISTDTVTILDQVIYYYRQKTGPGVGNPSSIISLFYTVKTLDGDVVFSHEDGVPIRAQRGTSTIYPPGFDEALQVMKSGDRFTFFFPSAKAYADLKVADRLPANSIVVLEAEVVREESLGQINSAERQAIGTYVAGYQASYNPDTVINLPASGISIIKTRRDTTAAEVPSGSTVTVNLTGFLLDGTQIFQENGFVIELGGDFPVIEGLEIGLRNMRAGERALVLIPSDLAYGASVQTIPHTIKPLLVEKEIIPDYGAQIMPFTPLIFDVQVVGFQ